MKKFLSITLCVVLMFVTACFLTACEEETPIKVTVNVYDPVENRQVGGNISRIYDGNEVILEVSIVTINGKKPVKYAKPTIVVHCLTAEDPYADAKMIEVGEYGVSISWNKDGEYTKYGKAEMYVHVEIFEG